MITLRTVPLSIAYRADIQGLRAVAVALVVLAHAGVPGFTGGFIGVDVFFVLSGYLITGLLVREHESTGRIRYGVFLSRRLKRLLPALLLMLASVLVGAASLLSAYETRMQAGSFLFSATWTSNIFFALVDRDYFSALTSEDLFLHTWSLGVEEQFYLVWPWLIMGSFFLTAYKARTFRDSNILLRVLAAVFIASLLLCLYWSKTQPLLAFYMMPARGWQFSLGAAVFVWSQSPTRDQQADARGGMSPVSGLPAGIIGILMIVGSAVLLQRDLNYPGYFALFPSLGAAMVIAAGTNGAKSGVSGLLAGRYFVWLGDRSYSLYLWHWPVLLLGSSFGFASTPFGVASLVGISLALAILSFRFIELPFWKGRFSAAEPARTVLVAVLAMVAVMGVSENMKRNVYGVSKTTTAGTYNPRLDISLAVYSPERNCDMWYANAHLIPCGIGNRDGESLAILLGDSIGAQWSTLISRIFPDPDWQVIVLTKSACAIVDESYYYEKIGADYEVCTEWRNSALDYIDQLKPDVVIVGSSAGYDFSESEWIDGTSRVLSRLSAAAEQVVVIPGTPALTFDGPSCLDEPYRFSYRLRDSRRECEEAQFASGSDEVAALLRRAAEPFINTFVLDMGDIVCPGRRCAAQKGDGTTVFRDNQHLTMSFVNAQLSAARERLTAAGARIPAIRTSAESETPD